MILVRNALLVVVEKENSLAMIQIQLQQKTQMMILISEAWLVLIVAMIAKQHGIYPGMNAFIPSKINNVNVKLHVVKLLMRIASTLWKGLKKAAIAMKMAC